MKPFERVWTTFNHEEPDRVPIYEGSIEPTDLTGTKNPITFQPGILQLPISSLELLTQSRAKPLWKTFKKFSYHAEMLLPIVKMGLNGFSALYRKYDVDLIGFAGGFPMMLNLPRVIADFRVKNGNTIITPHGDIATKISDNYGAVSRFGFLRSPEDYYKYIELDPDNPINYFMTQSALKAAKDKIALAFSIPGSAFFETMSEMFGFNTLFRLLAKEPKFIKSVVKDLSDFACATLEYLLERGAKIFYMTDDLGYNNRLFISPRMYNKFFKEGVAKFCNKVHQYGGKVMMHSCGNVMEIMDTLIEVGIDALHPWQPYAGMDIFEGKKRWGKKITLIGNVPMEMLSHGTRQEVVEYVKKLMEVCKPGGGYIISSSHSIIPTCKWENVYSMWWAAKKFGLY
ncbi:MAG: hypothetical protein GY870_03440 [archaeon]|nr:hypothetical protein [archaeon]